MRHVRFLPLLILTLFLTACGDKGPTEPKTPPPPSASGAWQGTSGGLVMTLTLSETQQAVSGSGNLTFGSNALAVTVQGTHAHPSVGLTLRASGYEDINFQGSFTDSNTMSGTLNGSGFSNQSFTLRRQ